MKQEEKIRVIVDVNIWISFLIGRRLQRIFDVLVKPQIVLIFSKELLDELYTVTQRPKFKKYFTSSEKSPSASYINGVGITYITFSVSLSIALISLSFNANFKFSTFISYEYL